MKRNVLNKKGLILLGVLIMITLLLGSADCDSIEIFIITKIIALITGLLSAILIKYLPSKYIDDEE